MNIGLKFCLTLAICFISACLDSATIVPDESADLDSTDLADTIEGLTDTIPSEYFEPDSIAENDSTKVNGNQIALDSLYLNKTFQDFSPKKDFNAKYFFHSKESGAMPTLGIFPGLSYTCTVTVSLDNFFNSSDTLYAKMRDVRECIQESNPNNVKFLDTMITISFYNDSLIHQFGDYWRWLSMGVIFGRSSHEINQNNMSSFFVSRSPEVNILVYRDTAILRDIQDGKTIIYPRLPRTQYFLKDVGLLACSLWVSSSFSLHGGFRVNNFKLLEYNGQPVDADSILEILTPL